MDELALVEPVRGLGVLQQCLDGIVEPEVHSE